MLNLFSSAKKALGRVASALVVGGAALGLTACGGGDDDKSSTVVIYTVTDNGAYRGTQAIADTPHGVSVFYCPETLVVNAVKGQEPYVVCYGTVTGSDFFGKPVSWDGYYAPYASRPSGSGIMANDTGYRIHSDDTDVVVTGNGRTLFQAGDVWTAFGRGYPLRYDPLFSWVPLNPDDAKSAASYARPRALVLGLSNLTAR